MGEPVPRETPIQIPVDYLLALHEMVLFKKKNILLMLAANSSYKSRKGSGSWHASMHSNRIICQIRVIDDVVKALSANYFLRRQYISSLIHLNLHRYLLLFWSIYFGDGNW